MMKKLILTAPAIPSFLVKLLFLVEVFNTRVHFSYMLKSDDCPSWLSETNIKLLNQLPSFS